MNNPQGPSENNMFGLAAKHGVVTCEYLTPQPSKVSLVSSLEEQPALSSGHPGHGGPILSELLPTLAGTCYISFSTASFLLLARAERLMKSHFPAAILGNKNLHSCLEICLGHR